MRHQFLSTLTLLVSLVSANRYAYASGPAELTVYAYVPHCPQTASGQTPRQGMIAVSRDLREQGWVFGRRVAITGLGEFVITDLMHQRHTRSIDILFSSRAKALRFGRQKRECALLARAPEPLVHSTRLNWCGGSPETPGLAAGLCSSAVVKGQQTLGELAHGTFWTVFSHESGSRVGATLSKIVPAAAD